MNQERKAMWIKLLKVQKIVKDNLHKNFTLKVQNKNKIFMLKAKTIKIARLMKRAMKKRAKEIAERQRTTLKNVLRFNTYSIIDQAEESSKECLLSFISENYH